MPWYELNATVTLSLTADSGADVALLVTAPDGTETTPVPTFAGSTWSAAAGSNKYGQWLYAWTVDGVAVEVGSYDVGGPWYATLAQLRHELNIPASNTTHDAGLARALTSAARSVEQWCDNRPVGAFLLASSAATRLHRPTDRGPILPGTVHCTDDGYRLYITEIGHATYTVETSGDGTTWTELVEGTDFEPLPDNALADYRPIDSLLSTSPWPARVRVTGRPGWPVTPAQVAEANLRTAARTYKRKDSPDGVAGSSDWGLIRVPNLDPDVRQMLSFLHTDALIG